MPKPSGSTYQRDRSRSSHRGNNNIFTPLGNNTTEHEFVKTNAASSATRTSNYVSKKCKPPPITVFDVNIVTLKNKLSLIKSIDLSRIYIKLTQHGTKINVHTNEDFTIVRKFCIDNKIKFFTHTLREERNLKICLYGLWNMNVIDLKKELNDLGKYITEGNKNY